MKTDKGSGKHAGGVNGPDKQRLTMLSPKTFEENISFITVTMNEFLVSYLLSIYKAFGGDIIQAMVLGAIAHHNVALLSRQQAFDGIQIKKIIRELGEEAVLAPCNAFSIGQATGIPRETVRRKITALIDKGWVKRDAKGQLFITDLPAIQFRQFNFELINEFLDTARLIAGQCQMDLPAK
jgi:hypothetical protein